MLINMSHVKNVAVAQLRITAAEKSDSEIVCLVDDDPAVLTSLERLLRPTDFQCALLTSQRVFLGTFRHIRSPVQ
jgi:hypothetical protein